MPKVYKNGKEMEYNDAPGALDKLKQAGWQDKKPVKRTPKKAVKDGNSK